MTSFFIEWYISLARGFCTQSNMTHLRQLRKRKDRDAASEGRTNPSAPDTPLSVPSREGPKHKTLIDIAAEHQTELQGGQPFTSSILRKDLGASFTTAKINPDGSVSAPEDAPPVDELIGPLGQAVFFAISLTMLHFTLDVLVHQQYRQSIGWDMIIQRTIITFPILAALLYVFHPRASALWAQLMFLGLSVAAGCYMIYSSSEEPYFAVMKRAPPLGTLWVWSVIEMRLEMALLSVVAVGGYFWWGGHSIF